MKTQLLQDIDENNSSTAPAPAAPVSGGAAHPTPPSAPPPAPGPKVWMGRPASPTPSEYSPDFTPPAQQAPAQAVEPTEPPKPTEPPTAPAPPAQAAPSVPPIHVVGESRPPTRTASRAGTLGACLLGVIMAGLIGMWMYKETKLDNTMALLAHTSAPAAGFPEPSPSSPAPAPATNATPSAELPPMVMLKEPGGRADPVDTPARAVPNPAPPPAHARADTALTQARTAANPAQAPAPLAHRSRTKAPVLASIPPKPAPRLPKTAPAPAATPARADSMAETLRLCRAAGYHTTQCIERGCTATRYGLACRG